MYPELFGVVKSYGLLLDISFILGILLCVRRGRRHGIPTNTMWNFCFGVLVSSLIGVRLVYVITHWDQFDPWYRIFYLWDGGLTLYGGIVLATLTVWVMCRRHGLSFLSMADVMAPAVMLGIGISRIGCFLSGCCYGLPTDLPWGVSFPAGCAAASQFGPVPLHPTQLYSSAAGLLVFALLLLAERLPSPTGATFGRFLCGYGLMRFALEFLRFREPHLVIYGALSDNQLLSALIVVVGAILLIVIHRQQGSRDA
jgi:phosphatidylglycerol:prolipoprotein diacylglycerol transferase